VTSAPATADLLQYAASFALVIALLVGLLWSLRKLQRTRGFGRREQRLQVVESMALGARHKVALIRVGHREVLVGITPQQITTLASWVQTPQEAAADFSDSLARARASTPFARDNP
jgi:flagellar protein FliO/FliZ